jgi:2-polyprenyl-3-methyl-5-hydroxy-6-metoxy-1,4-benzoquinol methylase
VPPGDDVELVPACDLCGSTDIGATLATRDRLHLLPGEWSLVRCASCGLGRLSPRPVPEALGGYYPEDEYYIYQAWSLPKGDATRPGARLREALRDETLATMGYDRPRHRAFSPVVKVLRRRLVERLGHGQRGFPDWVPGGRALDIGCGNGFFLAVIREYGWEVEGIDMSEAGSRSAKESFDVTVHVGDIQDVDLPEGAFDFVHMTHVVEHVASPTAVLPRVLRLLRPGGRAYIETPNLDSYGFDTWGAHWLGLDSPRHLWLFTPSTFQWAVEGAGFTIDRLWTLTRDEFAWEMTFAGEEREGRPRDPRPALRPAERAAVLAHRARSLARHRRDPMSGDFLAVWLSRGA